MLGDVIEIVICLIIFIAMLLGFAILFMSFLYRYWNNDPELNKLDSPWLLICLGGGTAFMLIVITPIFFESWNYVAVPMIKNYINTRKLLVKGQGIKVEARIIESYQTGGYINKLPEFELILEYNVPNKGKMRGKLRSVFGYGELSRSQVGNIFEIMYDPQDPTQISWAEI